MLRDISFLFAVGLLGGLGALGVLTTYLGYLNIDKGDRPILWTLTALIAGFLAVGIHFLAR